MKKRLWKNLKSDTYCRVGVSKVHGIGVIAIKDIPKDVYLFRGPSGHPNSKVVSFTTDEINKLDSGVQKMIYDYFYEDDGKYYLPAEGLNNINISYYLNHSNKPNAKVVYLPRHHYVVFKSKRKIKKGEEIFINYDT